MPEPAHTELRTDTRRDHKASSCYERSVLSLIQLKQKNPTIYLMVGFAIGSPQAMPHLLG